MGEEASLPGGLDADFSILQSGLFRPQDLRICLREGKRSYPPQLRRLIRTAWQEARLNPLLQLYNGRVASLLAFMEEGVSLRVEVQETDYRSFYGTNICHFARIANPALCANALAVCAVVETSDGCILIGQRSGKVAEGAGEWHVPGGNLELGRDRGRLEPYFKLYGLTGQPGAELNPVVQMSLELSEEAGIGMEDIRQALCLGLGQNLHNGKPEFLCWFQLKPDNRELITRFRAAPDREEHARLLCLPSEEIGNFDACYPVTPIGKAALYQFLYFSEVLSAGGVR